MSETDEEFYRKSKICRFCEKGTFSDIIRNHCHLTSKYKGPAQNKCIIFVTQKQSNFLHYAFYNSSNYDCNLFSQKVS